MYLLLLTNHQYTLHSCTVTSEQHCIDYIDIYNERHTSCPHLKMKRNKVIVNSKLAITDAEPFFESIKKKFTRFEWCQCLNASIWTNRSIDRRSESSWIKIWWIKRNLVSCPWYNEKNGRKTYNDWSCKQQYNKNKLLNELETLIIQLDLPYATSICINWYRFWKCHKV